MARHSTPLLTSEALITLSVAYGVPPPPLVLVQLGFDGADDNATADFMGLVDRGVRVLGALHPAVDPSDETKALIQRCVVAMGRASVFVALQRTDQPGSHVIYDAEDSLIDVLDSEGNHRLREIDDVASAVRTFFNGYDSPSDGTLTCPASRLGAQVEPLDGEDPLITELASDEFPGYLATVGHPARGRVEILGWRSSAERLFTIDSDTETATFTPTSTEEAVSSVMEALAAIRAGDPDGGGG